MSKARTQPSAQTGIVWKISIFLFILLAVVLYKMNDYFKQEKWQLAQSQLHTQIISIKTSVAGQISTLKNVLSSYEYDLSESKINWVQLDPFFGIAKAERVGGKNSNQFRVTQYIGRSGSVGARWSAQDLQKTLSRQVLSSSSPITVQIFQDNGGTKFICLRFSNPTGHALMVVGSAEYFQKFFDLSRGGKMTVLLQTTDHTLAAHSEADYLGSQMDENSISPKKFLFDREEIAGTNLIAMNFISRKNLTKSFVVPWSVVGLIFGFGLLIVGVLIYTLDPIEKRIEKYKMQEREQVFKNTLSSSLEQQASIQSATDLVSQKPELTLGPLPLQVNFPTSAPPPPPEKTGAGLVIEPASPPTSEETFIPQTKKSEFSGSGTVVLDSDAVETFDYMPSDSDNLDLDKALALDDADSEEATLQSVQFVKEKLTSKTINTSPQPPDLSKPIFAVRKKEFKVDSVDVSVRRPERS